MPGVLSGPCPRILPALEIRAHRPDNTGAFDDHDETRGVQMLIGRCLCEAAHWTMEGDPGPVTACNCSLCRRYGALWAYDYEADGEGRGDGGGRIGLHGPTRAFTRRGSGTPSLEIRFCPTCACVLCWRGLQVGQDGRRRMAVNVRLAPPEAVAHLPIDHFDGLDTFDDLPRDGRCVRDLWF